MQEPNNRGLAGELLKAFKKYRPVPEIARKLGIPQDVVQAELDAWRRSQAKRTKKRSTWGNS